MHKLIDHLGYEVFELLDIILHNNCCSIFISQFSLASTRLSRLQLSCAVIYNSIILQSLQWRKHSKSKSHQAEGSSSTVLFSIHSQYRDSSNLLPAGSWLPIPALARLKCFSMLLQYFMLPFALFLYILQS
uniref:Uncharacterized protein n=1 Tax=Glossina pallidipes TaxID=7398 RepID=A0A1A9ZWE3_GLOPL